MSDFLLFSISLAVTVVGLLASWAALRRRGVASGMRGASWSLVPMGLYLAGITEFLSELVFSPVKWAGVGLLGVAGVFYVVSGVKLRTPGKSESLDSPKARPAVQRPQQARPGLDDDLSDIEEILRRRGIG